MSTLISVCLICYNQEKYIEFTLNSILQQKDVLPEVIIADDCSSDGTKAIIETFIQRNSLDWKIISSPNNVGMQKNWQRCISTATGKYVALLEGDDFWNDQYKLTKQISILESDVTLSGCFTNAHVINEINNRKFPDYITDKKEVLTYIDFLNGNNIPTCTVVFRNHSINFPASYFKSPYVDWIIHLLNTQRGNYFYLDEKTSTYRLHEQGAYGGASEIKKQKKLIKTIRCIKDIFKCKLTQELLKIKLKHEYQILAYMYKNQGQPLQFIANKIKSRLI